MICAICSGPDASVTMKALNGLPLGVVACDPCRTAVKRRDLGVSVEGSGALSIYGRDGAGHTHPSSTERAAA